MTDKEKQLNDEEVKKVSGGLNYPINESVLRAGSSSNESENNPFDELEKQREEDKEVLDLFYDVLKKLNEKKNK